MAKPNQLFKNILNDVRVNLSDEFDRNFQKKAFFDRPWNPNLKWQNNRGSMMMRTGKLRGSLTSKIEGSSIIWTSSMPYAKIHNEGGEVTVTNKMKKFAWAMYYKAAGAVSKTYTLADGSRYTVSSSDSKQRMAKQKASTSERNMRLNKEAEQWKALALKKVGSKIKIEQRQFIGDHPQVRVLVEEAIGNNLKGLEEYIRNTFKQK